jgi:hypothetical protein
MGQPSREVETGDALDPVWEYPGLEVSFWHGGGGTYNLLSTSPQYCTTSGVCPGMSTIMANELLPKPIGASADYAGLTPGRSDFNVDAEACWLEVWVDSAAIRSLEISCQP